MTVSGSIPNLIGGISQQPAQVRFDNTAEDALNVVSGPAIGLKKRPPLRHIAGLSTSVTTVPAYFPFDRGGSRGRHVFVAKDTVWVLTPDGTQEPVSIDADALPYLSAASPQTDFTFCAIGDNVLVTNTKRTVSVTYPAETRSNPQLWRTVVIKQAVASTSYKVYINAVAYTHTTGTTPGSVADIATALRTLIVADYPGAVRAENVIYIPVASAGITFHSEPPSLTQYYTDTVERFTDLPRRERPNAIITVKPSPENADSTQYFVQYNDTTRRWEEARAYNQAVELSPATMPHMLVDNGDGTWRFRRWTWDARLVGDDETNSIPSFVGRPINFAFLWQNRLSFITGENLIRSEIGEFENFWRTTTAQLLPSDRDDYAFPSSTSKVADYRYAVPFDNSLSLFSAGVQYEITPASDGSGDFKATESTNYDASPSCPPVSLGRNLLFAEDTTDGRWASLLEHYIEGDGRSTVSSVTGHVPELIPAGVHTIAARPSLNFAAVFSSGGGSSKMYVYHYFWGAKERIQSAWHQWSFPDVSQVYSGGFLGKDLYIVARCYGYLKLFAISVEPSLTEDFNGVEVCLDLRLNQSTLGLSLSVSGGNTTISVGQSAGIRNTAKVYVVTTADSALGPAGTTLLTTRPPGNVLYTGPDGTTQLTQKFYVNGDLTGVPFVLGQQFTAYWDLSPLYARDPNGLAILDKDPQIGYLVVAYHNATELSVKVSPYGVAAQERTETFVSSSPGSPVVAATGKLKVGVREPGPDLVASIVFSGPFNARVSSIEWWGKWRPKTGRLR